MGVNGGNVKKKYIHQITKQIKELEWFMAEINKSYIATDLIFIKSFPKTYQNIQNLLRGRVRNLTMDLAKIKGTHTKEEWEKLRAQFKGICPLCNKKKKLTKDHIVAISNGGNDKIENIVPLCKSCNSRKHAS